MTASTEKINLLEKAENKLTAFYAYIKKNKVRTAVSVFVVYTVLYLFFFFCGAWDALSENGYLIASDGCSQYLPFLIRLRSSILAFFDSFSTGSPAIPMVDFGLAFGADATTSTAADLLPLLPYYFFSAFFPESAMPAYFTGGMMLTVYLSGLTFISMCVHFGKDPILSAAFAPLYVFCADFWLFGWGNPHFLFPFAAFPLMIIGIDRVIHGKSGVLLSLAVAFPALGGVHLLVYSVPFVVIFAAIRVYYVHKGTYWRSLGKYFLVGMLYTLLGVMLAAVSLLPFMNSLLSSARTLGNAGLTAADLFVPDTVGFSKMLTGAFDITFSYGTWVAALPIFFYAIMRPEGRNELRAYGIAAIVLMILPVTSYAINGFQYNLCRWGFVPATVIAFGCIEYVPKLLKPQKGDTAFIVFVCLLYLLAVTLDPGYSSIIPILIVAAICVIPPLRKLASAAVRKITGVIRAIPENLKGEKRYGTILLISVTAIVLVCAVVVIVAGKLYYIMPIVTIVMPVMAGIALLVRFTGKALPSALLTICLFVSLGALYNMGTMSAFVYKIDPQAKAVYKTFSEQPTEPDTAGRYSYMGDIADSIFPSDDAEKKDILMNTSKKSSNAEKKYCDGIPLLYDLPTAEIFNSTINGNYMRFLDRVGMDGLCIASPGQTWGYSGKEVMYSLFGINKLYTTEKCPYIYGVRDYSELQLTDVDALYYIYDNKYALPYGVTYDQTMTKERYDGFDPAALPYAVMNEVWLDGYENASGTDTQYSHECAFDIESSFRGYSYADIACYDNTVTISDSTAGCFLYISFDGMRSGSDSALVGYAQDFFIDMDNGMTHSFKILNPKFDNPWKYLIDHCTLSLGYCENDVKTLTFVTPFEYKNMKIYTIPASVYTDGYENICSETLKNVSTGINTLTGTLDLSSDKILSVNLLYNGGWEAYIDGVKAPLYKANGLFLGIPVTAGHHDIKLVYHTPYIYEGLALSCISAAILITITIFYRKRKKKGNTTT